MEFRMKRLPRIISKGAGMAALGLVLFSPVGRDAKAQRAAAPSWPCAIGVPTISSMVPPDAALTNQVTLNCFAWQEFIALNWEASPTQRGVPDPNAKPAQFGTPNAQAPKVWETYKDDTEVFLPNGGTPKAWNAPPPPPPVCRSGGKAALALSRKRGVQMLSMSSAFGDFALDETNQASGQWLADQKGNLIWYQIKLNHDEFDTIVTSQFYNASIQATTASTGKNPVQGGQYQVKLPMGCLSGQCPNNGPSITGAMEVKAAWRILPDSTQNGRYLTTQAVLVGADGTCTTASMGLVGLHIIHKTVSQPNFIWATFEQVDNVPPASPATFSNSSCTCQVAIPSSCFSMPPANPVYQNCLQSQTQGQPCTANTSPPYNKITSSCPAYPTQVSRNRPISSTTGDPVVATNTAAQQLIVGANANSVFQYYQLVDVLWSGSPINPYMNASGTPGPTIPLPMSGATPDPTSLPVANTTMETFVQTTTCFNCHVYAAVAGSSSSGSQYASDYSFLFGEATSPAARGKATLTSTARPRRSLPKGLVHLPH
jgi:hypothetical protein